MSKNKITAFEPVFQRKLEKLIAKIKKLRKCCPKEAKQYLKQIIKEAKTLKKTLK